MPMRSGAISRRPEWSTCGSPYERVVTLQTDMFHKIISCRYVLSSAGLGRVSVKLWASHEAGSSSVPSSVIEPEKRVAAAVGRGVALAMPGITRKHRNSVQWLKRPGNFEQHAKREVIGKLAFASFSVTVASLSSEMNCEAQQTGSANDKRLGNLPFHQNQESRYRNPERPVILD
jgi:hypothetical protein